MHKPQLHLSLSSRALAVVILACLLAMTAELWFSVRQLSQTADEGAHLYSGYRYWQARDYGLNPEHPPLLKLVAALPLLSLKLNQPHPPPTLSKFQEYIGGGQLLYTNDADRLLWRARIAASVFALALALLVFAAATEMFGSTAGLIALLLCVFEPNLLAHGALVTTDMVAVCTIFAAAYAFYRYQKRRTAVRLVVAGIAVGFALASKFSALILLPVFVLWLVAEFVLDRFAGHRDVAQQPLSPPSSNQAALRSIGALAAIFAISYLVLWGFYTFRYQARPGSLQLNPALAVYVQQLRHPLEARLILFLARWHLLPESYLYGVTDLQVFGSTFPSFLLGKIYPGATKLYFPIAFLIKNTLPLLVLMAALPFLLVRKYAIYRKELIFLLLPIVVFFAISTQVPQNIGVRHILPVFPFCILLAALGGSLLAARSRWGAYAVVALLLFHAVSSARAFPDYIPYSNEAFGGPAKTYRVLTDSNVDWGQGLKEVAVYVNKTNQTDCWFAHFSDLFTNPAYYKIPCKPLPAGFAKMVGLPMQVIPPNVHGTVLISASEASGVFWGAPALNPYAQLVKHGPDKMIGNSILVFHGDIDLHLASAQSHLGQIPMLMTQHKVEEALSEARTAATLAPDSPEVQATLGGMLLKTGNGAEAKTAFLKARELARSDDPDDHSRINELITSLGG